MALSKYELFHGAVLSQVVRNPVVNLKLFERNENHGWGMYSVSDNSKTYLLYIKSTAKITTGSRKSYSNFTFSLDHINKLKNRGEEGEDILLCLVCDSKEICLLSKDDLRKIGLLQKTVTCGITVSWFRGSEFAVKSGGKELDYRIPRNRLKNFDWK